MPLICYTPRTFSPSSLAIIETAQAIIEDYAAQGLSLTLRQLYYRFVAAAAIENTERSYKRIGSIINDARLAGLLDWEAIEDRGRELQQRPHWDKPQDIVAAAAAQYRLDKWMNQGCRVEVWVEKQALEGVIGQAALARDCPYFACKGYNSQSEMWRAAMRFKSYRENGQYPVIIHLGDHDPSGIDMTRDITQRINDVFGVSVEVVRIALNYDQVEEYDPPPNPAKMTDSRFAAYQADHGDESWELDALEPRTLNQLILDQIDTYLDQTEYDQVVEQEAEERRLLGRVAEQWDGLLQHVRKHDPATVERHLRKPKSGRKQAGKRGGR